MDLSNIKMVVSDMDGTLLNSNHEVSPIFFDLFWALHERKIQFIAASGRQYHSIIDKLAPIQNHIIVIAENGGFVMQQDRELLSTPLPKNVNGKVLQIITSNTDIHPVLCGKYKAYISKKSGDFKTKLEEYYAEYEVLDDLQDFDKEIIKIALYHPISSETYIYPLLKHLEGHLKIKVSGENWVDVSHENANKGYALQKIMDFMHIKSNELMVFGDYNNDLEMMALADYSFAMENAHPNVKTVAKYHTTSNDDLGVEKILERLL